MLLWQILGSVLSIAGVSALYLSWRRKTRSWPLVLVGWGLIFGAVAAWAQTSGVDKGPALGIIIVILTAMIAIGIVALRTPVKKRREPRVRAAVKDAQASVWHEGLSTTVSILAIVFVGLIASVSACTALFMGSQAAGMEQSANLTLTMFSFPLVWGALSTYIGYSESRSGRAFTLAGMITASAAVIFGTMQGS
ncbi:MAG: hypothetical protein AAGI28_09830 [Pseudomonadota bacterium]